MEERRRVPRQHVRWSGKCVVEGGHAGWTECRVIDISPAGLGLEVYGAPASELLDRRMAVEIHAPAGTSVTLALLGHVRNAVPRPQGGIRVGLELDELSQTQQSILNALSQIAR